MKRLLIITILCSSISSFGQLNWTVLENATPNTNGTRYDDVFFLNENVGWIANGNAGNVFKTTDGGESWVEQLNETDIGFDTYYRNIEFFDENNGIVTSLNQLHFKTTDGGESWTRFQFPGNLNAACGLSVVNSTTMYGCGAFNTPAFVVKTTDGGDTWEVIDMSIYATALVEVQFLDENLGYASGSDDNGGIVLRTTDGGSTWAELFNSNIPGEYVWKLQFVQNDPNMIFGSIESVPSEGGKIIKSFDAGTTWESKSVPIQVVQSVGFINPNRGWAGGHTNQLFETNDGGDTWVELDIGANSNRIFFVGNTAYCSAATILKLEDEVLSTQNNSLPNRKDLDVVIAPQPVTDKLNFSITFPNVDNLVAEVYDLNGRRIKQLATESLIEAGTKHYSFDFNAPSGTYFLSIQNNTGRQSMTFVKQ